MLQFKSFVQAATTWTTRKQRRRPIFKLERANRATQTVTQGAAFTPASVPLPKYPEEKNRRKKKQQINSDQCRECNLDHGVVVAVDVAGARATSVPHSIVAVPQTKASPVLFCIVDLPGKRQSMRYFLACSSRARSPEEFRPKQ
jgi:hypothetical protein